MTLKTLSRLSLLFAMVALTLVAGGTMSRPVADAQTPPRLTAVLEGIDYVALGSTTVSRIEDGFLLRTDGLRASATVNCAGNQRCLDRGLEGSAVEISQDFAILAVRSTPSDPLQWAIVGGRTRGSIAIDPAAGAPIVRSFRGSVTGDGQCAAGLCAVSLEVAARSPGGGTLSLSLAGRLLVGALPGQGPDWQSITGSGFADLKDGTSNT